MDYQYQVLIRHFGEKVITQGRQYLDRGGVSHVKASKDGLLVTGRVSAKPSQFFRVCLSYLVEEQGFTLESECTCQSLEPCRHAAAVFLHQLQTMKTSNDASLSHLTHSHWLCSLLEETQASFVEVESAEQEVESSFDVQDWQIVYLVSTDHLDFPSVKIMVGRVSFLEGRHGILTGLDIYRTRHSLLKPLNLQHHSLLKEKDIEILSLFDEVGSAYRWNSRFEVVPKNKLSVLLLKMIETQRAFILSEKLHVNARQAFDVSHPIAFLQKAQPKECVFRWSIQKNAAQVLWVESMQDAVLLKSYPPLLLQRSHVGAVAQVIPLLTHFSTESLEKIFSFHVSPLDLADFWQKEQEWFFQHHLPAPHFLMLKFFPSAAPQVSIHFMSEEIHGMQHLSQPVVHLARVRFHYEGQIFSPRGTDRMICQSAHHHVRLLPRNFDIERDVLEKLSFFDWVFKVLPNYQSDRIKADDLIFNSQSSLQLWIQEKIRDFKSYGWNVTWDDTFKFSLNQVEKWKFYLESSNQDWFQVGLNIMVEGEEVELLPLLLNYFKNFSKADLKRNIKDLEKQPFIVLPLRENKSVALETHRVRQIITTLVELLDNNPPVKDGGGLMLPVSQVARIAELDFHAKDEVVEWHGALEIRKWAEALRHPTFMQDITLPKGFLGCLRPYQYEGVQWLRFLRHYHLGGVLADDMGLGKTVQTLAHLSIEFSEKRMTQPVLIIAPTSLLGNWRKEAAQFLPGVEVLIWHGLNRKSEQDPFKYPIIITTYAVLVRDFKYLEMQKYAVLILDEAQLIKNSRTKVARSIKKIRAEHRLCLTGTPLENHIGELWSLFDFLMPGFLGSEQQFRKLYRNPIEKRGDQLRCQALIKRLSPFMLRRTKEQVAQDLPPKTQIVKLVSLSSGQSDFYESIRLSMNQKVQNEIAKKGLAASQIIILDALLKLRQVCCDPRIVKLESASAVQESAKLQALVSMLTECVESGRSVLVFSQFTSMLDLIAIELEQTGLGYLMLTGKTRHRDRVVEQFQAGKAPIFLISLKAGGTGLNLTRADTVIHYDPWWNPAVERQASDRVYRIGQNKPVFVYKLIAEGTVEEKIHVLQQKKHALLQNVVNGSEGVSWRFNEDDLQSLFAPIC